MATRKVPGLVKRGEVWHIDKQVRGRRIAESTGTTDRAEAERYLILRLEQIRRETLYGERPAVTLRQACEKFLKDYCPPASLSRRAHSLEMICAHIGDLDLTKVHDGALTGYREARRAAGVAAGTINLEINTLARVLNLAARSWRHDSGLPYIDTAPLLTRERGDARAPHPLTREEQRRVFERLTLPMAEVAEFFVNTGLRSGELRALRWDWEVSVPELSAAVFILPASITKTRRERVVVLNSVARRILAHRREVTGGKGLVFVSDRGGQWAQPFSGWRRAAKAAGVPARIHDLRHTFGQRLRAAGVDVETRADLLGHHSGRMTTHYSRPDLERLLVAAESVVEARPSTILRSVRVS